VRRSTSLLISLVAAATIAVAASGIWIDVPFVQQTDRACGAANAAMLLRYWSARGFDLPGAATVLFDLHERLYSSERKGTTGESLKALLTEEGLTVFVFRGTYADLQKHLADGRPLIVCLDPLGPGPLHYALVVGLDPTSNTVLVNDPARKKLSRYDRQEFLASWTATDNWTLLGVPRADN
jgi:ABC-type bacteriocin/lantibiotic exporter with double-glycine peptidase domain